MFAFQAVHNTKPNATEQKTQTYKKTHPEKLSKENSWSKNKIFSLRVDTSHTI